MESFRGVSKTVPHMRWELREQLLLYLTLQPGDRVLNVGGGAGATCILASKLVGRAGNVVCVDPNEQHMDLIKQNSRRNSDPSAANLILVEGVVQPIGLPCGGDHSEANPVPVPKCFGAELFTLNSSMPFTVLFIDCDGCMSSAWFSAENLFRTRVVVWETEFRGDDLLRSEAALKAAGFVQVDIPVVLKVGMWLRASDYASLPSWSFMQSVHLLYLLELAFTHTGGSMWAFCCVSCFLSACVSKHFWDYDSVGVCGRFSTILRRNEFPGIWVVFFACTCLAGVPQSTCFWNGSVGIAMASLLLPSGKIPQSLRCCCGAICRAGIVTIFVPWLVTLFQCLSSWPGQCRDWNGDTIPSEGVDRASLVCFLSLSICIWLGRWACKPRLLHAAVRSHEIAAELVGVAGDDRVQTTAQLKDV
eukprot:TRINITY_DN36841_c0_g1_i1.p1 TRINITY_DN36841_c0_g1~~TRINITY_DN36841_c0_g1_i1.p1  ORF type:complete len:465 (+),score=18.30 TRINITY_DN36841_c0_g1_i1:144-1397(+)